MMRKRRVLHIPQDDDLDLFGSGQATGGEHDNREPSPTRLSIYIKPKNSIPLAQLTASPLQQANVTPRNSEGKRLRSTATDDALSPAPLLPDTPASAEKPVSRQEYVTENIGCELTVLFRGAPVVEGGSLKLPRGDATTVRALREQIQILSSAVANYDRKVRLVDESIGRPSYETVSSSSSPATTSDETYSSASSDESDDFDPSAVKIKSEGALKKLTVPQLKQVLKHHDLPISGNKQTLIKRLMEADRSKVQPEAAPPPRNMGNKPEATSLSPGQEAECVSSPQAPSEVLDEHMDDALSSSEMLHEVPNSRTASVWQVGAQFLRRSVETLFFRRSSGLADDEANRRRSW